MVAFCAFSDDPLPRSARNYEDLSSAPMSRKSTFATKKPEDPPTFAEYEASINTNELARLHAKLIMDLAQDSRMGRLIFSMHLGVVGSADTGIRFYF